MSLSIWEYLRARTRDAVLAGFNDALDVVEQGDSNGSQHVAATQLMARLNAQDVRSLPEPSVGSEPSVGPRPSVNTEPSANGHAAHAVSELLGTPTKPTGPAPVARAAAVARPAATAKRPVVFDDELEQRLDAAAAPTPAAGPVSTSPAPGRLTNLKRRGRPPKNRQDEK